MLYILSQAFVDRLDPIVLKLARPCRECCSPPSLLLAAVRSRCLHKPPQLSTLACPRMSPSVLVHVCTRRCRSPSPRGCSCEPAQLAADARPGLHATAQLTLRWSCWRSSPHDMLEKCSSSEANAEHQHQRRDGSSRWR
ncbi:uncharacterized protein LOC123451204 isoform X1 [Hordeum vulgare subsp. vulgare]|uniref:uncharacterized protein LOC123451204 isoform X1 n=1 Tax=Hordeum vulgare subsp. vulgare TaxID=112509 RepID=UPI001D1A33E2|nr:uncharacterized protein LOC123451204 isoform X1 [Hordeum vulgare subsp. vulgare]